jgi:hypothetical protein
LKSIQEIIDELSGDGTGQDIVWVREFCTEKAMINSCEPGVREKGRLTEVLGVISGKLLGTDGSAFTKVETEGWWGGCLAGPPAALRRG